MLPSAKKEPNLARTFPPHLQHHDGVGEVAEGDVVQPALLARRGLVAGLVHNTIVLEVEGGGAPAVHVEARLHAHGLQEEHKLREGEAGRVVVAPVESDQRAAAVVLLVRGV